MTAASLGCRFATAFRGIVDVAKVQPGEWVAVHGSGGVGLSAIMIAAACGANVIAVDLDERKLSLAREIGAVATINAADTTDVVGAIREITKGGAHVSMDALGSPTTCFNSIACLRRRGRHVQAGLMTGVHASPSIPMSKVIAHELQGCSAPTACGDQESANNSSCVVRSPDAVMQRPSAPSILLALRDQRAARVNPIDASVSGATCNTMTCCSCISQTVTFCMSGHLIVALASRASEIPSGLTVITGNCAPKTLMTV